MGRRRRTWVAALVLGLLMPLSDAGACPEPDEEPLVLFYADTLTVTLRAAKKSYRPGQTVAYTVTVERRGPAGTSDEYVAADVKGRLYTPRGVEPDRFEFTLPESGTRTKLWRIPPATRPGPLNIEATALYELLPSPSCFSSLAYERGTAEIETFITITR